MVFIWLLLKSLLGFVECFPLGRHLALIERSDEPCREPGVCQAGPQELDALGEFRERVAGCGCKCFLEHRFLRSKDRWWIGKMRFHRTVQRSLRMGQGIGFPVIKVLFDLASSWAEGRPEVPAELLDI